MLVLTAIVPMFVQVDALPCAQRQAAVLYGDGQAHTHHGRLQASGNSFYGVLATVQDQYDPADCFGGKGGGVKYIWDFHEAS